MLQLNTMEIQSEMSKETKADYIDRQVSNLTQTQNADLIKAMKESFAFGWENRKLIGEIDKKFVKLIRDLATEYE